MEARIYIYSSNRNRGVVYFDQHLGAVHPKTLVEIVIFSFFMKEMHKSNKFAAKFFLKRFFSFFSYKNTENDYFNQRLGYAAPKRWSKYTTTVYPIYKILINNIIKMYYI